jgi:sortase A
LADCFPLGGRVQVNRWLDRASKLVMAFLRQSGSDLPRTLSSKRNSGFLRGVLPLLLVFIGIGLIGYVGYQYWDMYHSQQLLQAEWERQAAAVSVPGQVRQLSPEDLLTRVSIPKISMDAIVVEGASRKQLSIGPGHMIDTAMPGESGNAVITGHRDTFFRHIYELTKGDDIILRRNGEVFKYQVTGKKIVKPDDVSVLKQTTDPQLTLITCYPTYYIGPAPERLVIFSKLVEHSNEARPDRGQAQTNQGLLP